MNTLLDIPEQSPFLPQPPQDKTCRTCEYRARGKSEEHATHYEQYCTLQPTHRNTVGYKKIKVTNPACFRYSEQQNNKK